MAMAAKVLVVSDYLVLDILANSHLTCLEQVVLMDLLGHFLCLSRLVLLDKSAYYLHSYLDL